MIVDVVMDDASGRDVFIPPAGTSFHGHGMVITYIVNWSLSRVLTFGPTRYFRLTVRIETLPGRDGGRRQDGQDGED